MKGITSRQIAMAFTGSFLGAGFVSGQELMQFFAAFGSYGIAGMVLAVLLFCMFGCFVMKIARHTGKVAFDEIIVERDIPWLRAFFSWIFLFFLFGVVVVMVAGAGALLQQVFGIPAIAGNAAMALLLSVLAFWGAQGVIAAFSVVVPFLIVAATAISVASFFCFPGEAVVARPFSGENPLLGNWFFSMISFVSYNMMAAISILVPIAPDVAEERTIGRGIWRGTAQLVVVFTCILLPLIFNRTMLAGAELPMLALAERIHPAAGIVYAVLLFCGMFGSALSCLFGVAFRIRAMGRFRDRRLTVLLAVLAFLGSIFGFKNLIATLFPICGYIGFFAMAGIFLHYCSLQRKRVKAE